MERYEYVSGRESERGLHELEEWSQECKPGASGASGTPLSPSIAAALHSNAFSS
jgi:hypothetical protein